MRSSAHLKLAFVVPWYGRDLKGGAERQIYQVTTRLAARGHEITVLTTCSKDFTENWSDNTLPEGDEQIAGVHVHRFPVDFRDADEFNAVNGELLAKDQATLLPGVPPVALESERIFSTESINSSALEGYLLEHVAEYDAIMFMPYLYGTTLNILPKVAHKAWLQPCLHREAYAFLSSVDYLFRCSSGLLFNSVGEQTVGVELFGPSVLGKSIVVGEGVEHSSVNINKIESSVVSAVPSELLDQPFLLCLGRRDETKNIHSVVRMFREYKVRFPDSQMLLVLAGPGETDFSLSNSVLDLGFVDKDVRDYLLATCRGLVNPSLNESYSRVLMEAWLENKPVLVHADCLATATAVNACEGGKAVATAEQWMESFFWLDNAGKDELERLGNNGFAYAQDHAQWDAVIDRYEQIFQTPATDTSRSSLQGIRIRQMLPSICPGDAISNHAFFLHELFVSCGADSAILCDEPDPALQDMVEPLSRLSNTDILLYHHSIGTDCADLAAAHTGPTAVIYHNITPPEFFEHQPEIQQELIWGKEQLAMLADPCQMLVGVSSYNTRDFPESSRNQVINIPVDPLAWDIPAESSWMEFLSFSPLTLLFVGRVCEHKGQKRLVEMFSELRKLEPGARLVLAGGYNPFDPYVEELKEYIKQLGLENVILLSGKVSSETLHAFYRKAHVFVCASEHEGFCVPLIEAMWFDLPVLAYARAAIPDTLGHAAYVLEGDFDAQCMAAHTYLLATDTTIRRKVVSAQQARRRDFLPNAVNRKYVRLIHDLTARQ